MVGKFSPVDQTVEYVVPKTDIQTIVMIVLLVAGK